MHKTIPVGALAYYSLYAAIELLIALLPKMGFVLRPPDDISDEALIEGCQALLRTTRGLSVQVEATDQSLYLLTLNHPTVRSLSERLQTMIFDGKLACWKIIPA